MYTGLLLLCVAAVAHTKPSTEEWHDVQTDAVKLSYEPYDVTWEQFKQEHGKVYKNEEEEKERRAIFMDNIQYIEEHNRLYVTNQSSFYLGVTQFADMGHEEFKEYNKLHIKPDNLKWLFTCIEYVPDYDFWPATLDWRKKGFVTPVKNQGKCAASYAFAVAGAMEAQHTNRTGVSLSFSEQQIIDCSSILGNHGCDGGFTAAAYEYAHAVGGLESEQNYPYTGENGTCKFDKADVEGLLYKCSHIPVGNYRFMCDALKWVGPVAVTIDGSQRTFQHYKGGVYSDPNCKSSSKYLNHAMLVVGYGRYEHIQDYWITKNSFGTSWGLDGYVLMARQDKNMCGILTHAVVPLSLAY